MPWWILVIGALLAWMLADGLRAEGFALVVLALAVGWLLHTLHRRVTQLESELRVLRVARPPPLEPTVAPVVEPPAAPVVVEPIPEPAVPPVAVEPVAAARELDEHSPAVTSSIGRSVLAWFRGGNTIVRAGVVILFIGIAFLLRFAAEHAVLPIELRLAGVALAGIALVSVGWRLRFARPGYAVSLQGAGIGILYLVVFTALRLYGLLPAGLAFGLLAALSLLTALLAMLQNALPLAVIGFGGGFLAPVLTSTGQGSHIALFTYYLLLNAGIAWVALRKAWKLLNLVGFVFTFVIGAAWGWRGYQPGHFWSTELFLVLHFALYLWISVQYSRQLVALDESKPLPYVDGGLLFGLPIVGFGLQAALVKDTPYGLALSAAALSAVYLLLGRWLWRRAGTRLRLLTEGLLALGLGFLILVTPFALDARWTGSAWALQGAGVLWVALRQQRGWAALIGVLLQLAAALGFWSRIEASAGWTTADLIGALVLGGSALFSASLLRSARAPIALPWPGAGAALRADWVALAHWAMLGLGLLQALQGLWHEWRMVPAPALDLAWRGALLCAAAAALLESVHSRLRWPELSVPARVLAALALVASAHGAFDSWQAGRVWTRFALGAGWLEALTVGVTATWLLRRLAADATPPWRRSLAAEQLLLGWFVLWQSGLQLYGLAAFAVVRHAAWTPLAAIVLPTLAAWWLAGRETRWPVAEHPAAWRRGLLLPWLALLLVWTLGVNLASDGAMQPLPYVPLINPIDLGHGLVLLYALRLWRRGLVPTRPLAIGAAAAAFVWLSSLLVRTLHHWAGTPMWLDGAFRSSVVQAGLTLLWSAIALLTMVYATRRADAAHARRVWLAGAALLAVVVAKLFFIDLSSIGTLERIVSFLGVGGLMLVIGYLSPMPPAQREAQA
jgi:uncharacterized membrane protein